MGKESRRRRRRALILCCAAYLLASCSPVGPEAATQAPSWLGSAAAATVREYDHVPPGSRTRRIELVAENVITEHRGDIRYAFGEAAPAIAIGPQGRIFVFDPSNYRVAVFDPAGELLFELGGRGEGPGELNSTWRSPIGFVGSRLLVFTSVREGSLWSADGEFGGRVRYDIRRSAGFQTIDDGTILATATVPMAGDRWQRSTVLARYELRGRDLEEAARYAEIPGWAQPAFAGTHSGQAYLSVVDEPAHNVIIGFGADGSVDWIARITLPPGELGSNEIVADDRGRLWVFPAIDRSLSESRPVDVFTANGERSITAMVRSFLPAQAWQVARAGYFYGVDADPETSEWRIVRYRMPPSE